MLTIVISDSVIETVSLSIFSEPNSVELPDCAKEATKLETRTAKISGIIKMNFLTLYNDNLE